MANSIFGISSLGFAVSLLAAASGLGGCSRDQPGASEADMSDDAETDSDSSSGTETDSSPSADTGPYTGPYTETNPDSGGEALSADAGADRYALVGESIELDASASTGAAVFLWDFGDGAAQADPTTSPTASHSYAAPGRYYPVVTVYGGMGDSLTANLVVTATHPPVHQPRHSASLIGVGALDLSAVLDRDAAALTLVRRIGGEGPEPSFEIVDRLSTCAGPRTLSPHPGGALIACPQIDAIQAVEWNGGLSPSLGPIQTLPRGSRPSAALRLGQATVVALPGLDALAVSPAPGEPFVVHDGFPDARGLALWPDGRVAVSRWRSPDDRGELIVFDLDTETSELLTLAYDPTPASDTEIGGVPTYLDQILVSPTADRVAVPSLQANLLQGEFLNGEVLSFETTARAVVSFLILGAPDPQGRITGAENFDLRKQFDNRGFAAAGVHSSRGDYLFVAMRGSRGVERYDALSGAQAGTLLDVGYAPGALALSPDDRHLYVHAELDRELRVYDVSSFDVLPTPIALIPTVDTEPLSAQVLRGKQLFNDSLDPRLAKHGYIACAHCHLDGEADRRTWDFSDRGEGLRNTLSLLGRAGLGHGPLHWSANFDEVQDFEHDMRGPFGGAGLLSDDDWDSGTTSTTLGDPKAGLSADLDALAAYVTSLDSAPRSPRRNQDGTLGPEALAGQALFESDALGCASCHAGPTLTDSAWIGPMTPLLHDVGTIEPGSGQRLGQPLTGLDTPSLHGLWNSPPYLHNGSAADLHALLTEHNLGDAHGVTSNLSGAELDQLVAYLLSLEGPE